MMNLAVYRVIGKAFVKDKLVGYIMVDGAGNQGVISTDIAIVMASHDQVANATVKRGSDGKPTLCGRNQDLRTLRKVQVGPGFKPTLFR